jgi:acyl-coenzyme A thioesterase PaaI-like protein
VDATFRLSRSVATTGVPTEDLVRARRTLDETTQRLLQRTHPRAARRRFETPALAKQRGEPYRLSAFNPWGIPFEIEFTEDGAHASLVANALHEGPNDSVHGGVSAWLMDCMLGMLLQAQGRPAVTATLAIDYLARTPLDEPLEVFSRVTSTERRKVYAEGWVEHDGVRTLQATGLFIEIDRSTR